MRHLAEALGCADPADLAKRLQRHADAAMADYDRARKSAPHIATMRLADAQWLYRQARHYRALARTGPRRGDPLERGQIFTTMAGMCSV